MDSLSTFDDNAGSLVSSPLPLTRCWAQGPSADLTLLCTLRDGVVVKTRPILNEDEQRLQAFHLHLSPQTIYLRFGHLLSEFPGALMAWLARVDGDQRMAFVATDAVHDPAHEAIIGVARYDCVRPQVAEMAAVVADPWQGRGIGAILLYRLAIYGRSHNYTTFVALVSRRNSRAVRALAHCGLPCTLQHVDEDAMLVSVDITRLDRYRIGNT
jgi:GNAT superfamily N-acetyltransferase